MEGAEPGVARVQAVELNSEICIIVVRKDTLLSRKREKADALHAAEGSSPPHVMASEWDTTGVLDRGMYS